MFYSDIPPPANLLNICSIAFATLPSPEILLVQVQVGQMVISAPPMFLSAVKETQEPVEDKRKAMADAPLPAVPLQDIVPVEAGQKRKREQLASAAAAEAAGQLVPVVPDIQFQSSRKDEKVKTRHTWGSTVPCRSWWVFNGQTQAL